MSTKVSQIHSLFQGLEEIGGQLPALDGTGAADEAGARLVRRVDTLIEDDPGALAEALESFSPSLAGSVPEGAPPQPETRKTWRSYLSFQEVQPLQIRRPRSLGDLVELVRDAGRNGCRVKAAGSGHSFSDVAVTPDYFVEGRGLDRVLPLDASVLKNPAQPRIEVESGITVRTINQKLDERGLALENMGSFDGQTICGAVSTGTHGTGIGLGPLAAAVESLTVVTADGNVYRVEPRDGITDPAKYRHPEVPLRQDDDWFHSITVGMGCMGLIYSFILRAQPSYWLEQRRTLTSWKKLKPLLEDGEILHKHRHFNVLINPYPTHGEHTCLVSVMDVVPPPVPPPPEPEGPWDYLSALAMRLGLKLVRAIMIYAPHWTPQLIDFALRYLASHQGHGIGKSFRMLAPGGLPMDGYAAEIGFSLERHTEAAGEILRLANHAARVGRQYQTSPFSLRYVKGAEAYLAPQFGRDTCMIEVPVVHGTPGGVEIMHRYERAAQGLGGRPHWGLEFELLNGNGGAIRSLYPMFDRWLGVFREVNSEKGTFYNAFTSRLGFE